jgi:hypothetical protein
MPNVFCIRRCYSFGRTSVSAVAKCSTDKPTKRKDVVQVNEKIKSKSGVDHLVVMMIHQHRCPSTRKEGTLNLVYLLPMEPSVDRLYLACLFLSRLTPSSFT